jgi:phage-related holin
MSDIKMYSGKALYYTKSLLGSTDTQQWLVRAIAGISSFLIGKLIPSEAHAVLLTSVFMLVCADGILGSLVALRTKTFSSSGGAGTIVKALVYAVLWCAVLYSFKPIAPKVGEALLLVLGGFMIIRDLKSIFENAAKLGVPVPKKLLDAADRLEEQFTGEHSTVTVSGTDVTVTVVPDEQKPTDVG